MPGSAVLGDTQASHAVLQSLRRQQTSLSTFLGPTGQGQLPALNLRPTRSEGPPHSLHIHTGRTPTSQSGRRGPARPCSPASDGGHGGSSGGSHLTQLTQVHTLPCLLHAYQRPSLPGREEKPVRFCRPSGGYAGLGEAYSFCIKGHKCRCGLCVSGRGQPSQELLRETAGQRPRAGCWGPASGGHLCMVPDRVKKKDDDFNGNKYKRIFIELKNQWPGTLPQGRSAPASLHTAASLHHSCGWRGGRSGLQNSRLDTMLRGTTGSPRRPAGCSQRGGPGSARQGRCC